MRDNELKPGHGSQVALEGGARLHQVQHGRVVQGLGRDDGVVRRAVKEGRLGEVGEHRVGVDAFQLPGQRWVAPLHFVKGWVAGHGAVDAVDKIDKSSRSGSVASQMVESLIQIFGHKRSTHSLIPIILQSIAFGKPTSLDSLIAAVCSVS